MRSNIHCRVLTLLSRSTAAPLRHAKRNADVPFSPSFVFPSESDLKRSGCCSAKVEPSLSAAFFVKEWHLSRHIYPSHGLHASISTQSVCVTTETLALWGCQHLRRSGRWIQENRGENGLMLQVSRRFCHSSPDTIWWIATVRSRYFKEWPSIIMLTRWFRLSEIQCPSQETLIPVPQWQTNKLKKSQGVMS